VGRAAPIGKRSRITISVFAQCLLVCPGTARQYPAFADSKTSHVAHKTAPSDVESTDLTSEQRTLSPRVRHTTGRTLDATAAGRLVSNRAQPDQALTAACRLSGTWSRPATLAARLALRR
jgi:hypothetical protein